MAACRLLREVMHAHIGAVDADLVSPLVLAGVVLFGAALALGAALAPARRAIRVSPVAALAID